MSSEGKRPESNQPVLNAKLLVGKIVSFVNDLSDQPAAPESAPADEHQGTTVRRFQRHE